MTKNELNNAVIARLNETKAALATLDNETALDVTVLFPEWKTDTAYAADERIRYEDKLYRCQQTHKSQADWTPDIATSLWEKVPEPGQGDTPDNPIPYTGNMALVKDKYYSQDGVTYLCIRDTINPIYVDLKDLIGIYVEIVL